MTGLTSTPTLYGALVRATLAGLVLHTVFELASLRGLTLKPLTAAKVKRARRISLHLSVAASKSSSVAVLLGTNKPYSAQLGILRSRLLPLVA